MAGIPVLMGAGAGQPPAPGDPSRHAQAVAGVFLNQLLTAMQSTVPEDGLASGGRGEEIFRSHMNQVLAEDLAGDLDLGGWLLRGVRGGLKKDGETVDLGSGGASARLARDANPPVENTHDGRLVATG